MLGGGGWVVVGVVERFQLALDTPREQSVCGQQIAHSLHSCSAQNTVSNRRQTTRVVFFFFLPPIPRKEKGKKKHLQTPCDIEAQINRL